MDKVKPCSPEAHTALVDGITQAQTDGEIIYFAMNDHTKTIMDKLDKAESTARSVPALEPPSPSSTLSGKPNVTKVEFGRFKMSTNSIEVATWIIRLVFLIVLIVAMVYGVIFMQGFKRDILASVDEKVGNHIDPPPTP